MKHVITWFEIPVVDFERAKKFFEQILAIEIQSQQMGADLMGFISYDQEGVGGAIVKGENYSPGANGVRVYFQSDDLTVILDRVEPAGGKIIVPKTLITEEIGHFGLFEDTEGNIHGLYSKD